MSTDSSNIPMPTFYFSHGGGPCFFMDSPGDTPFSAMDKNSDVRKWYESFPRYVPRKPTVILVISAHWEEDPITITTRAKPTLLYDYYGFPAETYKLKYECPHSPQLASRLHQLLAAAKIDVADDSQRGLDHGVFIPLKLMYPDADIPVVQLSLQPALDPAFHYKLGQALAPLRDEGVLIMGSGSLTHNLNSVFSRENNSWVKSWVDFVTDALTNPAHSIDERKRLLFGWKSHPHGRKAHPREEHLVPLFVAMGAAASSNTPAEKIYDKTVSSLSLASFKFQ